MTRAPKSSRDSAAPAAAATPSILAECKILIGTPAYGGMLHIEYLRRLFESSRTGIQFELDTIGNESLITRAQRDSRHLLCPPRADASLVFGR